jgi:NAD(P)-dependent dehydrogenase (short-subunit alcohol dehydrogenase family)
LVRLKGRVVMVTGSGRGFGRSMAIAYGRERASVISVARTISELEGTEDAIRSQGGEVLTIPTDLASAEEILQLRDRILGAYGRLDVLVNNAATSPWIIVEEMTVEDWDRTVAVNLRAPFLLSKAFLEAMKAQGGGSIINVSSKSAEMGFVAEAAYCASKYGLEGLTQCLALEMKPHNVAVNSLNVSAPEGRRLKPTELTLAEAEKMPGEFRESYADDESMVDAFTDAWVFLALQDGDGVTGQRFVTKALAEELERDGWEAVAERSRGKLTKTVYEPYEFPGSVRYQTPDGGWKELKFG